MAFAFNALHQLVNAHLVCESKLSAAIVTEIELGKVAVQMRFAAMLMEANHAALEKGKNAPIVLEWTPMPSAW